MQVSSREQQQALQSGDLWAAVGPSSTLIPLAMRQNKLDLVAPASGTALWSHLWVVPKRPRINLPSKKSMVRLCVITGVFFSLWTEAVRLSREGTTGLGSQAVLDSIAPELLNQLEHMQKGRYSKLEIISVSLWTLQESKRLYDAFARLHGWLSLALLCLWGVMCLLKEAETSWKNLHVSLCVQPGPSPLLQAWLTFALEPQRASRKKGLQGGASPLLLPGHHQLQQGGEHQAEGINGTHLGSSGTLDLDLGSFMPSDAVLRRSEFLEPLDADTRELYREMLTSV